MDIKFSTATGVAYGGQNATRVYSGSVLVWQAAPPAPAPYEFDLSNQGPDWAQVTRTIERADDESAGFPPLNLKPGQGIRWKLYGPGSAFTDQAIALGAVAAHPRDLSAADAMGIVASTMGSIQPGVGTWATVAPGAPGATLAPIWDNNLWTPPADCAGKTYWLRFGKVSPLPPPFNGVTEVATMIRIVYST